MKIFCATFPFFYDFKHIYKNEECEIIKDDADISLADLIIFTGGQDINPNYYGEPMKYMNYFSKERDEIEEYIFWQAIKTKVPRILGVCRGHQLICALLGGKLFQDIHKQIGRGHDYYHDLEFIGNGGFMGQFFSKVNSMHHQGVYLMPEKLIPTSIYGGVFESCEGRIDNTRIYTVQFHPEFMSGTENFFENLLKV